MEVETNWFLSLNIPNIDDNNTIMIFLYTLCHTDPLKGQAQHPPSHVFLQFVLQLPTSGLSSKEA